MRETDFDAFSSLLDDVAALLPPPTPLSGTARAMYFRALVGLPLEEVRAALDSHVRDPQRGRFFPKPADVLAQVGGDGRPTADEAWATAIRGMDEAATIVWTSETALAWGVARTVMQLGDEVGARMAFRDAYNRLVKESRATSSPIEWRPSLGLDPEQRDAALREAASKLTYTPELQIDGPRRGGAPMLALEQSSGMPQNVRDRLAELRTRLTGGVTIADEEPSRDALDRTRTETLKRETQRKVDDYLAIDRAKDGAPVTRAEIDAGLVASGDLEQRWWEAGAQP